jgi:hypothetical protein
MQKCSRQMSVAAILIAGAVTGCSTQAAPSGPTEGAATSSASSPHEGRHHMDVRIVRSIDVGPTGLPTDFGSKDTFDSSGDFVIGEVTMDLCGADFFSEVLRTARHQVGYVAPNKDYVSTETVSYRDGGASMAMRELRRAIARCPTGYVHSRVAGIPPMKQQIRQIPHNRRWVPDTVAIAVTDSVTGRPDVHAVLIYQHKRNLIAGAYVYAGFASSRLASHVASLLAKGLQTATTPIEPGP